VTEARVALAGANGNLSLASRLLRISRAALAYRLRRHEIAAN
jgi:transcriptional regulator of acetoin/glycerol metabolism